MVTPWRRYPSSASGIANFSNSTAGNPYSSSITR